MLPKQVVRAAISQGQITHSQLIWSPQDNAWKQVRELPHLLPSQKLAPAPMPRVPTGPIPKVVAVPATQTGTVPRVVGKAKAGAPPKVRVGATPTVAQAATPVAVPREGSPKSYVVKEENEGPHPLMWLCIALGVLIFALVVVNFLLVDRPLVSGLGQTPYSKVTVYAHLGAFIQPNVIVIHIPASSALTSANLTDFLVSLARSTPPIPMSDNSFQRVGLTSGWTSTYTLSGYAWKQLGEMGRDEEAQRKEFLLDQLGNAVGEPIMAGRSQSDEAAQQADRDKVWNAFVAQFTRS